MGFNLNGLGSIIEKAGGGQFVSIVNKVGNPVVQVLSPVVNLGKSMLSSIISMQKSMMQSMSGLMKGVSGFVNSPTFMYVVIGGLAIAGIYVIQNGGKKVGFR